MNEEEKHDPKKSDEIIDDFINELEGSLDDLFGDADIKPPSHEEPSLSITSAPTEDKAVESDKLPSETEPLSLDPETVSSEQLPEMPPNAEQLEPLTEIEPEEIAVTPAEEDDIILLEDVVVEPETVPSEQVSETPPDSEQLESLVEIEPEEMAVTPTAEDDIILLEDVVVEPETVPSEQVSETPPDSEQLESLVEIEPEEMAVSPTQEDEIILLEKIVAEPEEDEINLLEAVTAESEDEASLVVEPHEMDEPVFPESTKPEAEHQADMEVDSALPIGFQPDFTPRPSHVEKPQPKPAIILSTPSSEKKEATVVPPAQTEKSVSGEASLPENNQVVDLDRDTTGPYHFKLIAGAALILAALALTYYFFIPAKTPVAVSPPIKPAEPKQLTTPAPTDTTQKPVPIDKTTQPADSKTVPLAEKPATPSPTKPAAIAEKTAPKTDTQTEHPAEKTAVHKREPAGKAQSSPSMQHETALYPYSIHAGSLRLRKAAEKEVATLRQKGLQAFWVQADLGKIGIWYRIFVGCFQTSEAAQQAISSAGMKNAKPKKVQYASFIGIFNATDALDQRKRELEHNGFSPYVVKKDAANYKLYVGAYINKESAQALNEILLAKGITAQVVAR